VSEAQTHTVWVRSWRLPGGKVYGASIQVDETSWGLRPDQVAPYAELVVRRSLEAEHDAAVLRLLTGRVGMSMEDAVRFLATQVRGERVVDDTATLPLTLAPGVADEEVIRPFLHLHVEGRFAGQWSPREARAHAMAALTVTAAADLDSIMERVLVGSMGLDRGRASAFVHELGTVWPSEEESDR
jgi:hypothetical protein